MSKNLKNNSCFLKKNKFQGFIYILFLILPFTLNLECNTKSELDSLLAFEANQISNTMHIFISFDESKFDVVNNFNDFKELEISSNKFLSDSNINIHVNCIKNESKNLRNNNISIDIDALSLEYKNLKEINVDIVTRNLIKKNTIKDNSLRGLLNYLNVISNVIKNNIEFQSKFYNKFNLN